MNLAFFEAQDYEQAYLRRALPTHRLTFVSGRLTPGTASAAKAADVISVFIYSKVDATVLKTLPKLKLITTRSTGFDHVDIAASRQRGITVCNVPFYGENTVAEHAFALLLALARRLPQAWRKTEKNDFSIAGLKGFDLAGRTLGVIGGGHIGIQAAKVGNGFGMRVLVFDPHPKPALAKKFRFRYVTLDQLLRQSDVLSLHAPYNRQTHHLINKKNIARIKKGAVLINTARGGIVETAALTLALGRNLSAAGLDVVEHEELLQKKSLTASEQTKVRPIKKLLAKDNVLFTPHIAFYTQEALERILATTVESIDAFSKHKLKNTVTR